MNKITNFLWSCILLMCTIFFVSNEVRGQVTLPHYDSFNYTTPGALQTQTSWTLLNSGDDITITAGSLSYPNLPTSIGNKISFQGAGIDAIKDFTTQTTNTVYASFLIRVTDLTGITSATGGYSLALVQGASPSVFGATFWTKTDGAGYQIGINPRTTTSNTVFTTGTPLVLNTTYMVVISYTSNPNANDDVVKLWLNPTLGGTEPIATLQQTNALPSADLTNVGRILVRQGANTDTPAQDIDELRIGTSWADVTPMMSGGATLVANPTTITDFGSINNGANSTASSYTLTATSVTNDVIVTAPTNFQVAKGIAGVYANSITYTVAELATAQTVGVRFSPTSGTNGVKTGNVTHSGFAGTNVAVSGTETGNAASPTLVANPTTIADFGSVNNGANSANSSYTLTATNLVNSVIVTAPTNFQVAKGITGVYGNSVTYTVGELATAQIVGVRFSPTSGTNGVKSGSITHSGFVGTTVAVSGTETGNVATATLTTNIATITDFGVVSNGSNSSNSSYTLTGTNITADVIVTAPANFQVAKTLTGTYANSVTYTAGELATAQIVGVRFIPTSGTNGVKSGNITHSGFTGTNVAVSGTENNPTALTLTTSPYVQNFDNIGTNLPTGWVVKTGATAAILGTDATFINTPTAWNSASANFRNVASATSLNSASTLTDQNNATNRALAIRQTGSFGDAGGAFVLQLANTSGRTNFSMTFKLQSLDNTSTRTTTWAVDYGLGAAPTTFTTTTPTGTLTTGATSFTDNDITVNFGNVLDNVTTPIWIRIVALTASSGASNRPTTAIDNVNLSWSVASSLVANPTTIADFGSINNGANSTASSYTLTGTGIANDVIITAPTNFQVAKGIAGIYASSVTYTVAELATAQIVGVRFSPTSGTNGVKSGNIIHSGFVGTTVAVSGTEAGNTPPNINLFLGNSTIIPVPNNTSLNLGNIPLSTQSTTFTIQNTGTANLTLGTITFTGTDGANATITSLPTSPVIPNGTTTFNVSYTPTSPGTKTVIFNLPNNDPAKNPYIVTMTFNVVAPLISVSQGVTNIANNNTPAYNMGSVVVSNNLDVTFTITNAGNSNLTLGTTTITGTGYSILTAPTTPISGANGTTTFTIRFNSATVVTNVVGTVTIPNNTGTANYVVNLLASTTAAPTPTIAVSQNATNIANGGNFDMGTTNTNVNNDKIFTITNGGSANLTITTPLGISGTGYSIFAQPTTPVAFGASNTTTFTVRFNSATAVTNAAGIVTITNNAGANYVINLTATAIVPPTPTIAVSQATTNIANGGTFDMGSTNTSVNNDKVFTITNGGNANLTITTPLGISGTGYSIFAQPTSPVAFGASNTTTFTVRFNSATAVTNAVGIVTITNNAGANYVINLTAIAIVPPTPTIAVSQATTNITNGGTFNMGSTNTGVNNDKIFTITNGGNANLTITTPLGISGTGYSIFAQPTSPVAFGANNTTTFTIRFNSATIVANASGIVTITNNAGANYVINLTASTTATGSASLTVLPTTLVDFGNVQTNQASITQSYVLSANNLTGNVTVTAPTNWNISKDNIVFTNILIYTPSDLATSQTIRVRFNPTSNVLGVKSGNITHATAGATTVNIAVTGTETTPNALENFSNDFIVSPNPAETFITIKCDAPNRWQKASITFYSIDGKSNSTYTWADATQTLQIDVKSWTRGLYILNIVEGSKIATKKIIVR